MIRKNHTLLVLLISVGGLFVEYAAAAAAGNQPGAPFRCTYLGCDQRFPNQRELTVHTLDHALTLCTACNKRFETKRKFDLHSAQEHRELQCPTCNTTVYGSKNLKKHIKDVHPEAQQ